MQAGSAAVQCNMSTLSRPPGLHIISRGEPNGAFDGLGLHRLVNQKSRQDGESKPVLGKVSDNSRWCSFSRTQ